MAGNLVWVPKGRDKYGSDVHRTILASGATFEVRSHALGLTNVYVIDGLGDRLLSMGFKSIEDAKRYVERLAADMART